MVIVVAAMDGAIGSGGLVDSPLLLLVAAVIGYLLGAWTAIPIAVSGVLLADLALTFANQQHFPDDYTVADDFAFYLLVLGAPAVAGVSLVARARQVRDLTALSEQLAAQRSTELAAARLEEQQRIESAVHHRLVEQMGAIALRADGARHEVGAGARDRALAEVEASARAGLDDLREALGLLRGHAEPPLPAPVEDRSRRPEPPLRWRDLLLPAGLGAAMAVESVVSDASRGAAPANVIAAFAVAAPLVARRRHPVLAATLALLLGAAMSSRLTPSPEMVTAIAVLLVASYAVGAHARSWWRLTGAAVLGAGCLAIVIASPEAARDPEGLLPTMIWCGLAVVAGMLGAGWAERADQMHEIVACLERSRDTDVRVAVARQRQAMARDLHDSVAHTLTVVCLNAGAARRVGAATAGDHALATIVEASRSGMSELRNGLDAIAPSDAWLQPRTVQDMAAALGVDLRVNTPADLSLDGPSASLLHRLLREAVVNAARYAPGAEVVAHLEKRAEGVMLEVTDDGSGTSPDRVGAGTGLAGLADQLRERGGRLDYGPLPGNGFRVAAMLPLSVGALS